MSPIRLKLITFRPKVANSIATITASSGVFGMDTDWVLILALVALNGLIDCTLVAWLAGRRSKAALLEALCSPDQEVREAIASIIGMAIVTNVKTGKRLSDAESGKEYDEELPLFKYVGRELSNSLIYKLKASRGGSKNAAGQVIADEMESPGLFGSLGPRKGQSTVDWAMEQAVPKIMPMLEKKMAEMIERGGQG